MSNAVKFTRTGRITVSLTHTPAHARLSVSDTGIGVPADKLPHIFNRFYQVDSSRSRAYEGTGIGLALVHELTGRLGGTVWVESEIPDNSEQPGTQFVVELPLQQVSDSTPAWSVLNPTISVISHTDTYLASNSVPVAYEGNSGEPLPVWIRYQRESPDTCTQSTNRIKILSIRKRE